MTVRVGVLLLVLSAAFWALIPVVPFVGLPAPRVAAVVGVLLVAAEIVFWLGLVLAGRDTWKLAKQHGWRRVPAALWSVLRRGRPPVAEPEVLTERR